MADVTQWNGVPRFATEIDTAVEPDVAVDEEAITEEDFTVTVLS